MTLALDGSTIAVAKAATVVASLDTANAHDVILVFAFTQGGTASITAVVATGLTFVARTSATIASSLIAQEFYATVGASAFDSSITATVSASTNVAILAFGVSGANETALFDTNASFPFKGTISAASISSTISTSFPGDFVFSVVGHTATEATSTVPANFTTIQAGTGTLGPSAAYYIPTGTVSSQVDTWKFPTSEKMIVIVDALQAATFTVTGEGLFSDTSTAVKVIANAKGSGEGKFAGTHAAVASGPALGEGRFAGTHTAVAHQPAVGEGRFGGSVSVCVGAPMLIDGCTGWVNGQGGPPTLTLSTENDNDVIVLWIAVEDPRQSITGITDTAGLVWNLRSTRDDVEGLIDMDEWWAYAPNPLTNDTITIALTLGSGSNNVTAMAFGVSGINTSAPWDTNVSLPAYNATGLTIAQPAVGGTYSVTSARAMVFSVVAVVNNGGSLVDPTDLNYAPVSPDGNDASDDPQAGGDYVITTSSLTDEVDTWGLGGITSRWVVTNDALVGNTTCQSGVGRLGGFHSSVSATAGIKTASGEGRFAGTHTAVVSGKGAGEARFAGTHTAVFSQVETGEGRFGGSHSAVISQVEPGEGRFAGAHTVLVSQVESGEGRFAGTHTAVFSQVESGEGRFAGTHSAVVSQHETGEGRFGGTHSAISSQVEPGEGRFAGTHTALVSQVEPGEGRFAGTHSYVSSQKVAGEGLFGGSHTAVVSQHVAGEGSFAGTHSFASNQEASGAGRFAGTHTAVSSQVEAGEGRFAGSHTSVVSQVEKGEGQFSGTHAVLTSQHETGEGRFGGTHAAVASQPGAGEGRFGGAHTAVVTQPGIGAGRFRGSVTSEVSSADVTGEGRFSSSITHSGMANASGEGLFSASVTSKIVSEMGHGAGGFAGTHSLRVSENGTGGGRFSSSLALVVSGRMNGVSAFSAVGVATSSEHGNASGEGGFHAAATAFAPAVSPAGGGGWFGAGITVYSYDGSNPNVPVFGCRESGGTSQSMIKYGPTLWAFGTAGVQAVYMKNSQGTGPL